MSGYDEQAMRKVVEERVAWATEIANHHLVGWRPQTTDGRSVAILAAEMLRQLPQHWPEESPSGR